MLVIVEVMAAISRQVQKYRVPLLSRARKSISDWETEGKIVIYELSIERMDSAVHMAEQNRLRGSDAVIAALAQELDVELKTFDKEVLDRFSRASA